MQVTIIKTPQIETEVVPSGKTRVYIHAEFEVDFMSRENLDVNIDKFYIHNLMYALRDDWEETLNRLAKC